MLTSAYPKTHLVKGISPELLQGNEACVFSPVFFVEVDGNLKWSFKPHWHFPDLREVKPGDQQFLLPLKQDEYIGINEGENLYLMGEKLYKSIKKLINDGTITFSLTAWKPTIKGYHCAVMTRCAFDAFRASLSFEIWPVIEDFIVTGRDNPDIREVFDTYDHLITQAEHEKQIHALRSGAFFKSVGDVDRLHVFSWMAVKIDGMFENIEEYEKVLERYLHSLRAMRSGNLI